VPIARGFALGYRKGTKGATWLVRLIDKEGRRETALGPADDVVCASSTTVRLRPKRETGLPH
jgi:hypothetical protein